ncbi:hypothetical protein ACSNN7_10005 [Micromonospora sp. URMC 105]|uniref:hypothetical protein n=1 Tax=Micromonospora sp. URMC 105 TaxID=3423413 RepID=UPI003F1ADA26
MELVAVREDMGLRNIGRLVQGVTEATGLTPAEFAGWANSNDGRLMLTTSAIQAANNTVHEGKIRALAAVLRDSIYDDAQLDLGALIVAAMSDLEAPHIRILNALVNVNPGNNYKGPFKNPWHDSDLENHFPQLGAGITPIMATLQRHGLAREASTLEIVGKGWLVTNFGHECLDYLTSPSLLDRPVGSEATAISELASDVG